MPIRTNITLGDVYIVQQHAFPIPEAYVQPPEYLVFFHRNQHRLGFLYRDLQQLSAEGRHSGNIPGAAGRDGRDSCDHLESAVHGSGSARRRGRLRVSEKGQRARLRLPDGVVRAAGIYGGAVGEYYVPAAFCPLFPGGHVPLRLSLYHFRIRGLSGRGAAVHLRAAADRASVLPEPEAAPGNDDRGGAGVCGGIRRLRRDGDGAARGQRLQLRAHVRRERALPPDYPDRHHFSLGIYRI